MNTKWLPVLGFEELYEVSIDGQIRSHHGTIPKILNPSINVYGYATLRLCSKSSRKMVLVHRLVAQAFLAKTDSTRNEVNHIDGNKTNNHIKNLEWVNSRENTKHAIAIGLVKRRLNKYSVKAIRAKKNSNVPQRELAERYGIDQSLVSLIQARKIYQDL